MNQKHVNIIYEILASGIDRGYKAGIRELVKQNKVKFTDPVFEVDYTRADKDAIRNMKLNAFVVAGVASWQLEEDLKQLAAEYQEGKLDKDEFELAVRQQMLQYGIGLGDQPPTGWLQTNLDFAIRSSISGAQWTRVNDPELKGLYSHWIYHSQKDNRVRPAHAKLEGSVFRIDDATAAKIIPPNEWNCRCYPEYITRDESNGMDVAAGSSQIENVPEDFRYNPASSNDAWKRWTQQKFNDMPQSEIDKLKQLLKDSF